MKAAVAGVAALVAALAVSAERAPAASCHGLRSCPANHYEYVWRGLVCATPRLADRARDRLTVRWHGTRWLCHRAVAPPPPPAPALGTRERPYPLGTAASVAAGRWSVRIDAVDPDATEKILAAEPLDDPPGAGKQFLLLHVTATFNGPGTAVAWEDLLSGLAAVGPSQIAYNQTDSGGSCGTVPDDLQDVGDVFAGANVAGNVCFSVRSADAPGLLVYWLDAATQQPSAWFALG